MKRLILTLAVAGFFNCLYSQGVLQFCASVEPTGHCVFDNVKFISSPDSSKQKIQMEVNGMGSPLGTPNVIFKIYSVSATGEEKFVDMVMQKIESTWFMAWSPYSFDSPGKYTVKVFGADDKLMCTKSFELMAFK
jgi:hypothetical protein